jgi:DNA-binding response OmpR family regulator
MVSKLPLRAVTSGRTDAKRPALRIVVADDDRDTANTFALLLKDEGHDVHTVLRGDEVLELCRLIRPDAVILDVNMPGMSGYAIARELHDRHGTLAPLLIAISGAWTKSSDRSLGRSVGFDHYLLKPCDPRELIPLLESLRSAGSEAASGD